MEEHRGAIIEGEDHDPMEDDDNAPKKIFEDDGMNALIYDTFGSGVAVVDDDNVDDDDEEEDDIELIHDIPLLEKENTSLYKGSQSTLLFVLLFLVNLKVMNGLSNITMSHMLRSYTSL